MRVYIFFLLLASLVLVAYCHGHHDDVHRSYHGYSGRYHGSSRGNHGYHGSPHRHGGSSDEDHHGFHPRGHVHHIHKHYDISSEEDSSEESKEGGHGGHHDRIYKFQVGGNAAPYEYLNEEGILQGFSIDILLAVCKKAGKKCAYLLDTYENCWRSQGDREYPGVGLMDGWYDGCVGWLPSPDRINTFNFTAAFTPNEKAALHWRAGEDVGDKNNIVGRKIGFMNAWAISQQCLKRQHNIEGHNSFEGVGYENHEDLVNALLNKEVEAILTSDAYDLSDRNIEANDPWLSCSSRGLSVMTHYHSDVTVWWNKAFAELQANGDFEQLCAAAKRKHGHKGKVRCI